MSTWTHHRAKVASLSRVRPADDPELIAARQSLKAAKLEETVREAVDTAPPLTGPQRDHLVTLLAGGAR